MTSKEFVELVGEKHRQIEMEIGRTFPVELGARWRAFPVIISPTEGWPDLDRFFDSLKNHADEIRKERETETRACYLSQRKIPLTMAKSLVSMTDEALDKMEKLHKLAHTLEDKNFIFAFQETRPNTVGLISWIDPKLLVMDKISVCEYKQLVYRDGNFCMIPDDTVYAFQLFDADDKDMLTVGKPFTVGGNQYIERNSFYSIKSTIELVVRQSGIDNMAEFAIRNIPLHLADETLQYAKECFKTIRTCRACGQEFYISEMESKWYLDKNMKLPGLCRKCRKARRDRIREEEARRQLEADYVDFGFY